MGPVGKTCVETEIEVLPPDARESLRRLYELHATDLLRVAVLIVGIRADAEEVVQESFVELATRIGLVDRPSAYLRTSVVNRSRSVLRRRRSAELHRPAAAEPVPEMTPLWDVLDRLPDAQRVAVVLRFYVGLRAAEIARMTGQPSATVRSHLRRALSTIEEELR